MATADRKQINIRVSERTAQLVEDTAQITGMTITQLLTVAVEHLYQIEVYRQKTRRGMATANR